VLIEVDFNSDEAIYVQLQNQIIMGIATEMIKEGDTLPSVRRLADNIGINMHTVNKAYSILKQEGFIQLDRCCDRHRRRQSESASEVGRTVKNPSGKGML